MIGDEKPLAPLRLQHNNGYYVRRLSLPFDKENAISAMIIQ